MMKRIAFLLPNAKLKPTTLLGGIEVFETANEQAVQTGKEPYFALSLVGANVAQGLVDTQLQIGTQHYTEIARPDLIIIPPFQVTDTTWLRENQDVVAWLVDQYKAGAEVASLCTGAFLLAATGLLKGKECSTHWKAEHSFTGLFPDVKLRVDKIITDNQGIYTAGGSASSLNLILYLIEKWPGRAVALYCAKMLQIDIERDSQAPFIIFAGQKNHDDEAIREVQIYIENHIDALLSVEHLAGQFLMSRRNFVRRFKKATHNAPIDYIQRVKMEVAKRSLETTRRNVTEVMDSVGYTDTKAFRTIFKKITGLTPVDYKTKFGRS